MLFSLIIPCYNEEQNIPILIKKCKKIADENIEIIIVNNGSKDRSLKVLKKLLVNNKFIKIVDIKNNLGYGHGILKGLEESKGDMLGWTHADLQTDPFDILAGLNILKKSPEFFVKGKRINRPLADNIFTIGMSIFETILFKKIFWDINAQPNLFYRSFYQSWESPPLDFSLDLYVYFLARKRNLKIYRFNVNFNKRIHGSSKWNFNWSSKLRFIMRTVNYSILLCRNKIK